MVGRPDEWKRSVEKGTCAGDVIAGELLLKPPKRSEPSRGMREEMSSFSRRRGVAEELRADWGVCMASVGESLCEGWRMAGREQVDEASQHRGNANGKEENQEGTGVGGSVAVVAAQGATKSEKQATLCAACGSRRKLGACSLG